MNVNYTTTLENKRLILVTGDESSIFLNNIVTNDINLLEKQKSIYSCLLSPQGKVSSHFFVIKENQGYIIIVDDYLYENLISSLNHYKLRAKVKILDCDNLRIIFSFNSNLKINHKYSFNDPRLTDLGSYYLVSKDETIDMELSGNEIFIEHINNQGLFDNIFKFIIGKYFALECNLKELNAISFSKGCYIGQENTSRMNLKNKISKRIIKLNTDKKLNKNEDIFYEDQIVGNVISDNPNFGIIKINKINFNSDTVLKTNSIENIQLLKPSWI